VHDFKGSSTYCHACGETLIGRDWYKLSTWNIAVENGQGRCTGCDTVVAGIFDSSPG
jgi:pyruvate formate lyase activating enzyme